MSFGIFENKESRQAMNIALYAHGGSGNHGCEALVRSTIKALGTNGNQFTVFSEHPKEDLAYHLDQLSTVKPTSNPLPTGFRRLLYNLRMKWSPDRTHWQLRHRFGNWWRQLLLQWFYRAVQHTQRHVNSSGHPNRALGMLHRPRAYQSRDAP